MRGGAPLMVGSLKYLIFGHYLAQKKQTKKFSLCLFNQKIFLKQESA